MIDKFKYANLPIILLAFFIFLKKVKTAKLNNSINVKIAGYILKASKILPFKSNRKDLCKPQPKQSIFKNVLLKQGSMYSSKSIKFNYLNMSIPGMFGIPLFAATAISFSFILEAFSIALFRVIIK